MEKPRPDLPNRFFIKQIAGALKRRSIISYSLKSKRLLHVNKKNRYNISQLKEIDALKKAIQLEKEKYFEATNQGETNNVKMAILKLIDYLERQLAIIKNEN